MAIITFNDKTTLVDQPSVAHENKVIADDVNEIKSVVNSNAGICDYSTSETNTGQTWTDGKTIYRKVVSSTSITIGGESTIATGLSNVSEYIKAEGFLYRTNNTCFPISRINPSNLAYGVGLYINQNDNTVRIETGSNVTNISKVVVVLEYTKSS